MIGNMYTQKINSTAMFHVAINFLVYKWLYLHEQLCGANYVFKTFVNRGKTPFFIVVLAGSFNQIHSVLNLYLNQ